MKTPLYDILCSYLDHVISVYVPLKGVFELKTKHMDRIENKMFVNYSYQDCMVKLIKPRPSNLIANFFTIPFKEK